MVFVAIPCHLERAFGPMDKGSSSGAVIEGLFTVGNPYGRDGYASSLLRPRLFFNLRLLQ